MAVRTVDRRGTRHLVIDIQYRDPEGRICRFRKDSKAATLSAAREEEKRIRDRIARTGSPYEPVAETSADDEPTAHPTFSTVVEEYLKTYAPSALKHSTRVRYGRILKTILLPRFGESPIEELGATAIRALDADLSNVGGSRKKKLQQSTRNNVLIVVRSVLRFAIESEMLATFPSLPPLKRVGKRVVTVLSQNQVARIINAAPKQHRLAFMLGAYAGLRAGEIRGLQWGDVTVTGRNGSRRGELIVRRCIVDGVEDVPKSGDQRRIPLVSPLLNTLAEASRGRNDAIVALNCAGEPWKDDGLAQAFERARDRAGVTGFTVHSLRHFFISSWLAKGVGAHVVQAVAGHESLATTQRYAHVTEADLENAVKRVNGNIVVTEKNDGRYPVASSSQPREFLGANSET